MVKKDSKQRLFEVMSRVAGFNAPEMKKFSIKEDDINNSGNNQNNNSNQQSEIHEPIGINPKYTHFAVLKSNNDIVNGWDYSEIDPQELKQFKKDYFFNDLADMGIDPSTVTVVTTNYLKKSGINPFDQNNWTNVKEGY